MKLSKLVVTSALVAVATGLASGTAYAQPDTSATTPDTNYSVELEDRTIVTTIDAGVFKVADDGKTVDVLDAADNTLVTLPLSFNLGGLNFPYEQNVDDNGKTLRLVPQLDLTKASANSRSIGATTVASPEENLKAQQNFSSQLGIATAIGGFTGTAIGALAGGLGFLGGPIGFASVPLGATVGGIVGTVIAGGPTLVVAGIDLLNTLNAAPGTSAWAK
ncbi:ammonium transporter [Rhodococcus fascians]|nr:ammonium transporter [Rhodococcus fascians]MBY3995296.1 ammonium transporter [Rhodococcus fascians]MBY4000384.1 ammonium transporter [Rhodococcus fascians]MBY4005412.1 ammonium transporter [Rhodococcus fascians]MBY4017062.1 ammonium transporter [Rhodococcus fascians]